MLLVPTVPTHCCSTVDVNVIRPNNVLTLAVGFNVIRPNNRLTHAVGFSVTKPTHRCNSCCWFQSYKAYTQL